MAVNNSRRRPLEGGYQCEFVEKPKELQSECFICLCILCEPYTPDCCGNKFCRTCIKRVEDDNRPCPLCNIAFTSVPDRQLERQLNERKVYCKNTDKGCNWIGELRKLKQHLNPGAHLDSVQQICDFQEIQCLRCRQYVERKKLNIPCPHLPSEPCPYKYAGCTFKKSKPELEAHLQQNVAYHATLAARKTEALDADIKIIRAELQAKKQRSQILSQELETLKQTSRIIQGVLAIFLAILLVFVAVNYHQNEAGLQSKHVPVVQDFESDTYELCSETPGMDDKLHVSVVCTENGGKVVQKLDQKLRLLNKTTAALEKSTRLMSDNIIELNAKTDAIETATWKLNTTVKQLDQEMKVLEQFTHSISGSTKTTFQKTTTRQEQERSKNKPRSMPPQESPYLTLPVHLTLTNFGEYRDNGSVWHSLPFFTREGHKLILTVDLNGEDTMGHKYTELNIKLLSKEKYVDDLPHDANFTVELSYNTTVLGQDLIFLQTETVVVSCLRPSYTKYIRDRSNLVVDRLQLTVSAALVPHDNGWSGWITTICKLLIFLVANYFMAVTTMRSIFWGKFPVFIRIFFVIFFFSPPMVANFMIYMDYASIGYLVLFVYTVFVCILGSLGNSQN